MLEVVRVLGFAIFASVLANGAMAYGTEPVETVPLNSATDVQIASACMPQLSPQMAAAFGLPLLTPPTCPQG